MLTSKPEVDPNIVLGLSEALAADARDELSLPVGSPHQYRTAVVQEMASELGCKIKSIDNALSHRRKLPPLSRAGERIGRYDLAALQSAPFATPSGGPQGPPCCSTGRVDDAPALRFRLVCCRYSQRWRARWSPLQVSPCSHRTVALRPKHSPRRHSGSIDMTVFNGSMSLGICRAFGCQDLRSAPNPTGRRKRDGV